MALEYIKGELNKLGKKDLAKIVEGVRGKLGHDIDLPTQVVVAKEKAPETALDKAIQEYKTQPLTPELVTQTWQTFLRSSVEKAGLNIPVGDIPVCARSKEELEELAKEGRFMVYVPDVDYSLLGKIFPEMQSYSVGEGSSIKNEYDSKGWVDVEMDLESPNRNTTEEDLEKLFKSKDKRGQTLKTYIWASQFSKALTGHYFDEIDTWSRLPGSRGGGRIVSARFHPHGCLSVHRGLHPRRHVSGLGGRSEGVK